MTTRRRATVDPEIVFEGETYVSTAQAIQLLGLTDPTLMWRWRHRGIITAYKLGTKIGNWYRLPDIERIVREKSEAGLGYHRSRGRPHRNNPADIHEPFRRMVSSQFLITLPFRLCQAMGLAEHDLIDIRLVGDSLIIRPAREEQASPA